MWGLKYTESVEQFLWKYYYIQSLRTTIFWNPTQLPQNYSPVKTWLLAILVERIFLKGFLRQTPRDQTMIKVTMTNPLGGASSVSSSEVVGDVICVLT